MVETRDQLKYDGGITDDDVKLLEQTPWWLALLTTRVLLAHTININNRHSMLSPLISNIRNLLRVVGIDIADKVQYGQVSCNDIVVYKPLLPNGKFWLSLKANRDDPLKDLETVSYIEMEAELTDVRQNNPSIQAIFDLFGQAVHELVSTRDSGWVVVTKQFAT